MTGWQWVGVGIVVALIGTFLWGATKLYSKEELINGVIEVASLFAGIAVLLGLIGLVTGTWVPW